MKIGDFFFPPVCFHCNDLIEGKKSLLCKSCAHFFDPIKPQERCFFCFRESHKKICPTCKKDGKLKTPLSSVWDYFGPIPSFISKIQNEPLPSLIKIATSYLHIQLSQVHFPEPEVIVTTPQLWLDKLCKGHNSSIILAKSFSDALKIPFMRPLQKNLYDSELTLKKSGGIEGKRVLFVDTLITKEKMKIVGDLLMEGGALKVCALTLAISEI